MSQQVDKNVRNKVLIVHASAKEKEEFEAFLESIVDAGGELIFAEKRADALAIIRKEHPQLVFLDSSLIGSNEEEWVQSGVHIVVMREKNMAIQASEDFILKPLKRHQVLEKCREVLNHEIASPIPPM